ncbi:helix-turn-helix domain-containing protein [Methylobacterium komagatae]
MAGTIAVREFASAAEMMAHYAAVNNRCFAPAVMRKAPPVSKAAEQSTAKSAEVPALAWSIPVVTERKILGAVDLAESEPGMHARFTVQQCVRTVALIADVTITDLRGESRRKDISKARQIAYFLLRHYLNHSFPKIGRTFGGRDHTTALHGYNRVEAVLKAGLAVVTDDIAETAASLWDAEWPMAKQ